MEMVCHLAPTASAPLAAFFLHVYSITTSQLHSTAAFAGQIETVEWTDGENPKHIVSGS